MKSTRAVLSKGTLACTLDISLLLESLREVASQYQ